MDPASTEYRTKRDLVRTWSDEMRAPPELKTYLKTQMETLLPQLPPKMREAFSSHPEELLQNGFALDVGQVGDERDALLATTMRSRGRRERDARDRRRARRSRARASS